MKARQGQPTPEALFINDSTAPARDTARWTDLLRTAGADVRALRWPSRWTPNHRNRISDHDFTHFRNTAMSAGRPVVIGRSNGAEVTYRLLAADAVRAGVLIDAPNLPLAIMGAHSPMLLLDDSAPGPRIDALREDGICDQQARSPQPGAAVPHDGDANLAQYIRDWLDFHQLLTR